MKKAVGEILVKGLSVDVSKNIQNCMWSHKMGHVCVEEITDSQNKIRLTGQHGISMSSYGENLTVEITEIGDGYSAVQCESKSIILTTLFDYGQNKKNVEVIFHELNKEFKDISHMQVEESRF